MGKMEPCGDDLTPTTARAVFVEWEDIQSHEDWNEESEANTTCTLKSLGWLIEDDDRKIVIAMTYDYENARWANKFAIGKLPPVITPLVLVEPALLHSEAAFRHVPRPLHEPTEEERHALNPNRIGADQFHTTACIPGHE